MNRLSGELPETLGNLTFVEKLSVCPGLSSPSDSSQELVHQQTLWRHPQLHWEDEEDEELVSLPI